MRVFVERACVGFAHNGVGVPVDGAKSPNGAAASEVFKEFSREDSAVIGQLGNQQQQCVSALKQRDAFGVR